MISIVIPTFKRVDLLKRLLISIEGQTRKDFEVILVDDCSPNIDEYSRLLTEFSGRLNLRYYRNSINSGAPYSRNVGINNSKFELVALVDDDDEWLPTKIEKQIEFYNKITNKKRFGILCTWASIVNNEVEVGVLRPCNADLNKINILNGCIIPSPSVIVSKRAIINSGLFDEKLTSCQDWDMWTRILWNGYNCYAINDVVTIYHKHEQGNIGLSPKARDGYRRYYKKHLLKAIICLNFAYLKRFIAYHLVRK